MIRFQIPDMTCSHCESAVRAAVSGVDPGATVTVDLATHQVSVDPTRADTDAPTLERALRDAGYTPALQP